jgi:hypothetical protein
MLPRDKNTATADRITFILKFIISSLEFKLICPAVAKLSFYSLFSFSPIA